MCTRCVRFTREITQTGELQVMRRGNHAEIDVFPGQPVDNPLAGNVVDLCPVGALLDKDFLHKQRVWFLSKHDAICTRCSTGCNISAEENRGTLWRFKPRAQPARQRLLDLRRGPVQLQGGQRPRPARRDVRPQERRPRPGAGRRGHDRGRPRLEGGRAAGRDRRGRPLAVPDRRGSVPAGVVPEGAEPGERAGPGPGAHAGARTGRSSPTRPRAGPATPASSSRGRSRSTPRSARTAGASRPSSSTSRGR